MTIAWLIVQLAFWCVLFFLAASFFVGLALAPPAAAALFLYRKLRA